MTTYQKRLAQPAPRMGLTKPICHYDIATESRRVEDDVRNYECKKLNKKKLTERINEQIQRETAQRKTNEQLRPEWILNLNWNTLLSTKLFNKHA